ncbi:hypothetical protein [Ignicoccus hospitalis]|uniref:Prefoldin subunit alpha n=1 Tax=Ignicoccus hospitalis (strain KIN4/I / DSM 18386 / JCM 14125) TaxID=453591 RepID=A8ABT7_IGNH4|nr:hypothetical protein [Ignicoccus hospitalis]ABU82389.1 hypothetical protein Igni_1213 [Ignicoccus hospitalis KIN4/I]HIH90864.1 hypothetical protein [Desulfurococcaceae archaeon]
MAEVLAFDSSEKLKEYIEKLKDELEEREMVVKKLIESYEEEVAELEVLKKMGASIQEGDATLKLSIEGVPLYIRPNPLKVYNLLTKAMSEINELKNAISVLESIAEKLKELPGFAVVIEIKGGKPVAAYMDRIKGGKEEK